jgi:hypothetical protein
MCIVRKLGIVAGEAKHVQGRDKDAKGRKAAAAFNSSPFVTSPFLLPHINSNFYTRMRRYCDGENIDLEILSDLHVLSTLEYRKVDVGMPYICIGLVHKFVRVFK